VAARLALSFIRDDAGATAVEYGLIITLIFLAIIGAVTSFGVTADTMINRVSNTIASSV
jgi:pilus assembly protein Flp/PilA